MSSAMLPGPQAWRLAAENRADLFQALDPGARIGLVARGSPEKMLVWESSDHAVEAKDMPFKGYGAAEVDILLAADNDALEKIVVATEGPLFEVLRAGIRSGSVVCYMLRRRCDLETKGYDEILEALGFVFMGACR
ncbi:hypothetical protein [Thauera aromatica]|nr:hypothetical protein [Thauera aromatica]